MKWAAFIVFGLHTLAELTFGTRAFITGAFSFQNEAASAQMAIAVRFSGAALIALGLLGATTLLYLGIQSKAGKAISGVLAIFHTIGVCGIALTAVTTPEVLSTTQTIGAGTIHGTLALGFIAVYFGLKQQS